MADIVLTRGPKCTSRRRTILIAYFLRGHLNLLFLLSFDPKFFKAAAGKKQFRQNLALLRGTCQYIVKVCYRRALILKMHTLCAGGPTLKNDNERFWNELVRELKEKQMKLRHLMTSNSDRRKDKSGYQECTCEMDKSLKRGMCIKFESRKICIAGNQCDKSDLDIHNVEDKKLHVFI